MKKLMVIASAIGIALQIFAAEQGLVAHFTFDDATKFGYDNVQKKVIGVITSDSIMGVATAEPTSCDAPIVKGLQVATGWWQNNYMTVSGSDFGSAQGIPYSKQDVSYSLWIKPKPGWQSSSNLAMGSACRLLTHGALDHEWDKSYDHHIIYIVKDGTTSYPKILFTAGEYVYETDAAVYALPGPFDGGWHHVAAVRMGAHMMLYYDGQLVADKTATQSFSIPNQSALRFGSPVANYDKYLECRYMGAADDIKVYNRVLSADEILASYQAGATAYDTDVLAWDGAAAGGAVENADNWSTKSNRRTKEEILSSGAVLDATSLDEAGVLTHEADATLKLKGVICTNEQDEVTLQMKTGTLEMKRPSTQRGLVAHLSFDDPDADGQLVDSGTAGLTATKGSWSYDKKQEALPIQSVEGVSGKAMYFPASGAWWYWPSTYVVTDSATTTKANGIPNGGETVTYSLWLKPYGEERWNNGMLGLANSTVWIFRRGNYGEGFSTYLWLSKGSNDGCFHWSIADWIGDSNTCTYEPSNLFDGNWHHVVCVYENKTLTLYYDGVLAATKATANALSMTDGKPIILGSNDAGDNNKAYRRYLGGFDEFKIFNVALTAEEVAEEYAKHSKTLDMTSAGTVPSPVKLQLDAGTTAKVRGYGHEYGSLFGVGSLSVGPASLLTLDGTYGLSGALTGCGSVTVANLVLGGDTDAYVGDFTIAENAKITVSDADGNLLNSTFGGKVILPKKAVIAWGKRPDAGKAVLTAGTLVPPSDFTEWTDASGRGIRIKVAGNQLTFKIRTGMTYIVR